MGGRNGKENEYTGSLFSELETEKPKEIHFDNCLVLAQPEYREIGKIPEWVCSVHAQRSIFQQETDMELVASATNRIAEQSKRKNLRGIGSCSQVFFAMIQCRFRQGRRKLSLIFP